MIQLSLYCSKHFLNSIFKHFFSLYILEYVYIFMLERKWENLILDKMTEWSRLWRELSKTLYSIKKELRKPPIQSNVNSVGRLKHSLTVSSWNEGSRLDWFLSLNRDFYHDFASHHSVRLAANTAFKGAFHFFALCSIFYQVSFVRRSF